MSEGCIHCGGLQDPGTPIRRGLWLIGPTEAYRESDKLPISRAACRTFYAIARANGRPITHRDLPNATAQTLANHMREIRKALGDDVPLYGIGNRGFAWVSPPERAARPAISSFPVHR